MSLEIERKFLVRELPAGIEKAERTHIKQGYLAITEETEVRLRKNDQRMVLSVKRGKGEVRHEYEVEVTQDQFERLWPATNGNRIEKVRFLVPFLAHVIELDVYKSGLDGLLTAEVEFSSVRESASFEPPEWFGADVTDDDRFKNKNLAVNGIPKVSDGRK